MSEDNTANSKHNLFNAELNQFKMKLLSLYFEVNCTGNETRLEDCAHPAWGEHSCGHFEDAGVRCAGPDTSRECVDKCGDGYFEAKGENKCGVCMASCLTCSKSADNCTTCDKPHFLKGNLSCL